MKVPLTFNNCTFNNCNIYLTPSPDGQTAPRVEPIQAITEADAVKVDKDEGF